MKKIECSSIKLKSILRDTLSPWEGFGFLPLSTVTISVGDRQYLLSLPVDSTGNCRWYQHVWRNLQVSMVPTIIGGTDNLACAASACVRTKTLGVGTIDAALNGHFSLWGVIPLSLFLIIPHSFSMTNLQTKMPLSTQSSPLFSPLLLDPNLARD